VKSPSERGEEGFHRKNFYESINERFPCHLFWDVAVINIEYLILIDEFMIDQII